MTQENESSTAVLHDDGKSVKTDLDLRTTAAFYTTQNCCMVLHNEVDVRSASWAVAENLETNLELHHDNTVLHNNGCYCWG